MSRARFHRRVSTVTFVLAAAALPSLVLAQRSAQTIPGAAFDRLIDSTLALWKVPGVAIAVVKGDRVLTAKGYGVRSLETKAPVTTSTKFAIGSVTKSFTVTALAVEIERKKLTWDTKVRDLLPDFRLYDDVATREMTVRDLVSHRSGLPRHDLMWYGSPLTRRQIYERLRYLKPNREFRSDWQYQNLMFLTAGLVAGSVNGTTWEETVRQLVFEPLGMETADFSVADMQASPDFALPYGKTPKDSVYVMAFRNIDQIGPAGSINANVDEMAKYLSMHMHGGTYEGRTIMNRADSREMQTQQMVVPVSSAPSPASTWTELAAQQYGLALAIGNYRGHKLVQHGGNIDGFSAALSFLPNDSIGVVVLTNMNGTSIRDFIPLLVYDRLLGLPTVDWNARFKAQETWRRKRQAEAAARRKAERKEGTHLSHPIADYAGTYTHPAYGDVVVTARGEGLQIRFNSFDIPFEHFHYDTFQGSGDQQGPANSWRAQFEMNVKGEITSVTLPLEPAVGGIVFTRKPAGG